MRADLLLVVAWQLFAAPDPREIIRHATEADQRNEAASRNYTFVQRVSKRYLNSDGSVKRTEIRTYDVTLSEGTPYQRLIAIDDKPLPPDLHSVFARKTLPSGAPATDETVRQNILKGKGMMPSFSGRFTEEQMAALLVFLHRGLR